VLEYFDAHIIGLTATPSMHTLGFFCQNLVAEYPYECSVADGVNVGYEANRIKTKVSEQGSKVEAGYQVPIRERRSRKIKYKQLDSDIAYAASELDIFWLKDESLDDIDSLPPPDVIALEIVDNLEVALEQFRSVAEELS